MTRSLQFFLATLVYLMLCIAPTVGSAQTPERRSAKPKVEDKPDKEWEKEREHEEAKFRTRPRPPMAWGGGIEVEPIEGGSDTIAFHIGSPVFLRLKLSGDLACQPFNGKPFYFDMMGAQLGWGFEEITDSTLFPRTPGSCERIVMLSSENSNRIPEGVYTLKVMIFVDEKSRLYSDTVVVQPVRSTDGASNLSYRRFLLEQIINNSPLLHDPETIQALFAEGTPKSAESEIYRSLVMYRSGDISGSEEALRSAHQVAAQRGAPLDPTATAVADWLAQDLRDNTSAK